MLARQDLEAILSAFDAEVSAALDEAAARLGRSRRLKLGDLNLTAGVYEDVKPAFRTLYCDRSLRRSFFSSDSTGRRSRRLLLVFMSEMVYWEYERSFWRKLEEVLEIDKCNWFWFTRQMRRGYEENNIPLIGWTGRNEYVRSIIAESGFSRKLVKEARRFVIWFFDHYSDLDPRTLDSQSFESILDRYGIWDKSEMFDLLRQMVLPVNRLLREIRKRSLSSADLRNDQVVAQLEQSLGFHPVKGIFGFRKKKDVQELLEQLSKRVRPEAFRRLLRRKAQIRGGRLRIVTPTGEVMEVKQPKAVPVMIGSYRIVDPSPIEIHVVPREALALSSVEQMIADPKRVFHQDGPTHAWIHDDEPFEVYQGSAAPEQPRPYCIAGRTGHLWHGKQKIGISLRAEREGRVLSRLAPRHDIRLNPHLRLDEAGKGLEVVIPSFVCYQPDCAGQTVRLELNGRPVGETTYVMGRDGSLQFQGTRVAPVLPEDDALEVRLVTVRDGAAVTTRTVRPSWQRDYLFSRGTREVVGPGHRHYGGDRFVLYSGSGATVVPGHHVTVEQSGQFGPLRVLSLRWNPDGTPGPFELTVGDQRWSFARPVEVHATLRSISRDGHFQPLDRSSAFAPQDLHVQLLVHGLSDDLSDIWPKLSLLIEKDDSFVTDFSMSELQRMHMLRSDSGRGRYVFDPPAVFKYLIGQQLIRREVGAYRWTVMLRPEPLGDLEPLSEMDFTLLPQLRALGLDAPMSEGVEALITVLSDFALLADEEDRSTDVLQVACIPEAYFDTDKGQVQPRAVHRTLRLTYPLTKVGLRFDPALFAVRLVANGSVRPQGTVTRGEAKDAWLAVLAPVGRGVRITGPDFEERIETDDTGRAQYALDRLSPAVQHERTRIRVECGDARHTFSILWHPSLRFRPRQCALEELSADTGTLVLAFDIEGPPDTAVSFLVADSLFGLHGRYTFPLAALDGGTAKLPVDLRNLQDATMLLVTAYAGDEKQHMVRITRAGANVQEGGEQLSGETQKMVRRLPEAELSELPSLVGICDSMGDPSLVEQALHEMYSLRRIDQVRRRWKRGDMNKRAIDAYFERVEGWPLVALQTASVPQLKMFCGIPSPTLQVACAEALVQQGDGVGVEEIIDLLADDDIPWHQANRILDSNHDCTSEMIRDMVRWDDLELEDDLYIELMEKLSHIYHPAMAKRARAAKDWKRARDLLASQEAFEAKVIRANANGLVVPIGLVPAQVPIEEIDLGRYGVRGSRRAIRDKLPRLVDRTLLLVVFEVNRREGRLNLSESRARAKLADKRLDELSKGQVRAGVVTGLADFGAFIDLGGIDGLIHVSELSWSGAVQPSEIVSVGDKLNLYVLEVDRDRRRVRLSLKRTVPGPTSAARA